MSRLLRDAEDAFGHALMDHLEHGHGAEIIERSDGYVDLSSDAKLAVLMFNELRRRRVLG